MPCSMLTATCNCSGWSISTNTASTRRLSARACCASVCGKSKANSSPPMRKAESERSEEHTSELQSLTNLVCRLLLEKKKRERGVEHLHLADVVRVLDERIDLLQVSRREHGH